MSIFKWTLMVILLCALFVAPLTIYAEDAAEDIEEENVPAFSYSDGIDENGFWDGLTALDYVELPEFLGIIVPKDTHVISDDAVQEQIDSILAHFAAHDHVSDRAVADGDTVNIDYVGSIDGVEFDGGSTEGAGIEVTIGVDQYIDDFLEQLIGHMPGETFDVNVTFPEDYGVDELNGKDAVFVTTINDICVNITRELTDEFVAEFMSPYYDWTTVEEMRAGISADMQKNAIQAYISEFIVRDATVRSLPPQCIAYHENIIRNYYNDSAEYYEMDLESFLSEYFGVASIEEMIETSRANFEEAIAQSLIYQAIAEVSGITVSDDDIASFFMLYNIDDYSMYVEQYGLPYFKQIIVSTLVLDHIAENAILEE